MAISTGSFAEAVRGKGFEWFWLPASTQILDVASLPPELGGAAWAPVHGDVFQGRPGFAWFRAKLAIKNPDPNLILHFDGIDDVGVVFLNGKRLAKHSGWNEPFDVRIAPVCNSKGTNVLTVLVQNLDGPGGVTGASLGSEAPESGPDPARPRFDDRSWRKVHLPHDYVIEGPFDPLADNSHGSLPLAPAWYRKMFFLPAAYKNKNVWIDFDGVYRNSTVYLNGRKLGNQPSGYIGFRYSLETYGKFGKRNVLAVHVDPRQPEGWWYEGGGIYRHVWLNVADKVHIAPWGVEVRTKAQGAVHVVATLRNNSTRPKDVVLRLTIKDPGGRVVARSSSSRTVPAQNSVDLGLDGQVAKVRLWSIEDPALYHADTSVLIGGHVVDSQSTPFGIRTIRFDKDRGFFLNGKHVKLKGTCNHQDHAGVGIGIPDGLFEWRIRKLKEMGSNAYRCSHNPPAPELLDACDRLGMLVMDETRHFGDTVLSKTTPGTPAKDLSELRSMITRDRNHPSVIMWSLANEEPLQGSAEGASIYSAMKAIVRQLDPSRPCTAAMNGGWGSGISRVEDLVGMNYGISDYDGTRRDMLNVPIFASETASTFSTRGVYANARQAGWVCAYDTEFPGHGASAEGAWKPLAEREWMAGGFVWTGFDYKGEPAPYGWPSAASQFGILDSCGFPKDNFYYYKAWWGDRPVVHLAPHWNWKKGQQITVWAFGNGDHVELSRNGHNLGSKPMPRYGHIEWPVAFEPGTLVAKAYEGGRVIATDQVETTGAPAGIRLSVDRKSLKADGEDVVPVAVEIVDSKGRIVPQANNLVRFNVSGASFAGGGNGDPSSQESDLAPQRHAFNGRCMGLVGRSGHTGGVTVQVSSPGLRGATLRLEVR